MLNDTGSSYQTVFDTDLILMGDNKVAYRGYGPLTVLRTSNGDVLRRDILFGVKFYTCQQSIREFPNWIRELGVITPAADRQVRLSGLGVRRCLFIFIFIFFFGTSPSKNLLIVAERKTDLCLQLQRLIRFHSFHDGCGS